MHCLWLDLLYRIDAFIEGTVKKRKFMWGKVSWAPQN